MAVYLFFEESGSLDFGPSGSRYFCVGTLATRDPAALEGALGALRYELLAEGVELEVLHHASAAHAGLQAADYALWAVHRKWQGGNARSHVLVAPFLRSERRTDLAGGD